MRKFIKFTVPLLLLACGIFFIFAFEFYIKDRVNTVPVVVAATDIGFKETFNWDNLVVMPMKREHLVKGAYIDEESISKLVGQVASIDITTGTQLYPALIDSYDLVPDYAAGEFIAPIPNDWIFAVPGSLRRSYVADFYLISAEQGIDLKERLLDNHFAALEVKVTDSESASREEEAEAGVIRHEAMHEREIEAEVEYGTEHGQGQGTNQEGTSVENVNADSANQEDTLRETTLETSTEQNRYGEPNSQPYMEGRAGQTLDSQPVLENIRVIYTKDSSNREVQTLQDTELDGTANISNLEIIANEEILNQLKFYANQGYTFYITYKFKR